LGDLRTQISWHFGNSRPPDPNFMKKTEKTWKIPNIAKTQNNRPRRRNRDLGLRRRNRDLTSGNRSLWLLSHFGCKPPGHQPWPVGGLPWSLSANPLRWSGIQSGARLKEGSTEIADHRHPRIALTWAMPPLTISSWWKAINKPLDDLMYMQMHTYRYIHFRAYVWMLRLGLQT
jgi:hypothetical protein